MPELPEVEVITRDLQKSISGKKIRSIELFNPGILKSPGPEEFLRWLCGNTVFEVSRRGKYILFYFTGGLIMEVHLRMTGRFFYREEPAEADRYTRAIFYFKGGSRLDYHDIRRFGTFLLEENNSPRLRSGKLGPDPLEEGFDLGKFRRLLEARKKRGIKSLLLNQEIICGLGNIYTDEALHRAGVHPAKQAGSLTSEEEKRLYHSIRATLEEAISFRGTSFSDYRDLWGREGVFQKVLSVYRKKGDPCPVCGWPIQREVIAGRGTYLCRRCQPFLQR